MKDMINIAVIMRFVSFFFKVDECKHLVNYLTALWILTAIGQIFTSKSSIGSTKGRQIENLGWRMNLACDIIHSFLIRY